MNWQFSKSNNKKIVTNNWVILTKYKCMKLVTIFFAFFWVVNIFINRWHYVWHTAVYEGSSEIFEYKSSKCTRESVNGQVDHNFCKKLKYNAGKIFIK